MYPNIVSVTPGSNFTLAIEFDDGQRGVLDMKPYLDFGVFRRLRDPEQFRRVRIAFDAVQWDNGVDLDPEFVAEKCDFAVER